MPRGSPVRCEQVDSPPIEPGYFVPDGRVQAALERSRPNILFIMSDDHASRAIGVYGSKINKTPSIDRIAAHGMRFADCFLTNAICTPSRAAIL